MPNSVSDHLTSHTSKIMTTEPFSINLGAKFIYESSLIDLATQNSVLIYFETILFRVYFFFEKNIP